ncbi:trigger factor [Aliikangiella marina]|uniref:Trigger factor n=1 Tax=Aliikangiella marina TaxID=1712262 RepID=A0A545TDX2_9GAMM|nr:trigger factor [Aliikangiella marina]TQV75419.1 trigger factor [Aliikangiella marina]
MQVSVETTNGLERKLTIGVPASNVDDVALTRMKELAKSQRMNGFRPGKIPLNVIKKRFGGHVRQEVVSEVMQRSFYEAVVQEKLQPAGAPHIEPISVEEGKDLEFTATFEIYPEVELKDFANINIEKMTSEVKDEDLTKMIDTLREQQANWVEVKRKSKEGDQVNIDFVGKIDGEEFAGGKADGFDLELGSKQMIPGFEDQLIGAKAGDEVEVTVTFPEDYQNKEVAGKEATFATTVNIVNKKEALKLGELAEKLGIEDGSVPNMKADVRKNMERELNQVLKAKVKEQVMESLVEAHEFDIPKAMIDQEIEALKQQAMQQFGGQGASLPDLPAELFEEKANRRVKLGLIVAEVIKQNKLTADKDKVRSKLEEIASVYEQPEQVVNYYLSDENRLNEVEQLVLEDSVIEFVENAAAVTEKAVDFDAVMNPKADAEEASEDKAE